MTSPGPPLIYDKSAIQGLTEKEAQWLHQHFQCVLTPTIYHEVLADLKKTSRAGKTPEAEVAAIARKIPSYACTPSMYFRDLIMEDFMAGPVEMSGRPYIAHSRKVRHPDGRVAAFFEVSPEAKAFGLWQDAKFSELDHLAAEQWRSALTVIDLKNRKKSFSWMKDHLKGCKRDTELLDLINKALALDPYRMLTMAIQYFQVPEMYHDEIINRWIRGGGKASYNICHMFLTFLK